jgi:hypothetical protein
MVFKLNTTLGQGAVRLCPSGRARTRNGRGRRFAVLNQLWRGQCGVTMTPALAAARCPAQTPSRAGRGSTNLLCSGSWFGRSCPSTTHSLRFTLSPISRRAMFGSSQCKLSRRRESRSAQQLSTEGKCHVESALPSLDRLTPKVAKNSASLGSRRKGNRGFRRFGISKADSM